jgi:hypothetical protein
MLDRMQASTAKQTSVGPAMRCIGKDMSIGGARPSSVASSLANRTKWPDPPHENANVAPAPPQRPTPLPYLVLMLLVQTNDSRCAYGLRKLRVPLIPRHCSLPPSPRHLTSLTTPSPSVPCLDAARADQLLQMCLWATKTARAPQTPPRRHAGALPTQHRAAPTTPSPHAPAPHSVEPVKGTQTGCPLECCKCEEFFLLWPLGE